MKAALELLDRDGQVRQTHAVTDWPLRLGRGLDNDVVLSDPHVAAQHLRIEPTDAGLELVVGDSANGVRVGTRALRAGERLVLDDTGAPLELSVGRTRLQLRLPGHTLAPELPLGSAPAEGQRPAPVLVAAAVLLALLLFQAWLVNDPDELNAALGSLAVALASTTALWCGGWALLTKTFTRRSRLGWHLKVFLLGAIGWTLADAAPGLLAFMFSAPAISDFGFVLRYAVAATALYFHLLAVEPARPRLLRSVAVVAWVSGVSLALWFNHQRADRYGDDLYLSHLYPPALRLAKPVSPEAFIDATSGLKPVLERKSKESAHGNAGGGEEE